MNNLKMRLGALAVLAVVAVTMAFPSSALAGQATKPREAGGSQSAFENTDFIGASVYRIENSTPTATPVLLVTGSGIVYGVDASSGVSGDFCQAADSASVSGLTLNTVGKWVTPQVFSATAVTQCTSGAICGSWNPRVPRRFENGLVGWKQGSGACYFVVRKDIGTNPGP